MKKIKIIVFVVTLLMASFILMSKEVSAADTKMIENGSFDSNLVLHHEDNADNYQVSSFGHWTAMAVAYIDDVNGLDGTRGLGLTACFSGIPGGLFNTAWQDVVVEENRTYTLTFYAKSWGDAVHSGLHIQGRNLGEENSWAGDLFDKTLQLTSEYQKYTITFNVAERTSFRLAFFVLSIENTEESGIGGVFIDNVELDKPENMGNLLGDKASLECAAVGNDYINSRIYDKWSTLDSCGVLCEPNNAYNGNWLANLMYRIENPIWPLLYTDQHVEKNTNYRLTLYIKNWAKSAYPDQSLIIGYRNMNSVAIWEQVQQIVIVPTENFEKYEFTFNTGELDDIRLVIFTQANTPDNGLGGMTIDVESLEKITGEENTNLVGDPRIEKDVVNHFDNNHDDYQVSSFGHWTTWWYAGKDAVGSGDASAIKLDYAWTEFVNVKDVWSTAWTDVELKKNTNYCLTFDANNYTAGVDPSSYFRGLFVQGRSLSEANSWSGDIFEQILSNVPQDYHNYKIVFNSGEYESMRLAFFVLTADPEVTRQVGLVLLDNISIVETEDEVTIVDIVNVEQENVTIGTEYEPLATSLYSTPIVKYYLDENGTKGAELEAKPQEVGTYWVEVTSAPSPRCISATKEVKYEITKIKQELSLTCDSITVGETVNPAAVSNNPDATITYKFFTCVNDTMGEELVEVPTMAGTYFVIAYASGNAIYTEAVSTEVKFEISKVEQTITVVCPSVTYGNEVNPTIKATDENAKIIVKYYSSIENNAGEELATTPVNAGTYFIKAFVEETEKYCAAESVMVKFEIKKASNSWVVEPSVSDINEGEQLEVKAEAKVGTVVITYIAEDGTESSEAPKKAGKYSVKFFVAESENYKEMSTVKEFTITAKKTSGCQASFGVIILICASMSFGLFIRKRYR